MDNNISNIIQLYLNNMYQNINSADEGSSVAFELLLKNAINSTNNGKAYIIGGLNSGGTNQNVVQQAISKIGQDFRDNGSTNRGIPPKLLEAIDSISKKYNVDAELVKSIIKQESDFNPDAVSMSGAKGMMQLMPSTAKSLGVDNPFNALENIDGGTRYLKSMIDSFGGNKKLALAAYNGGIGRMKNLGVESEDEIKRMPKETQNYVSKVFENYYKYKNDDVTK